jgi:glycosyltransferase involved in cell wall biosynthesis
MIVRDEEDQLPSLMSDVVELFDEIVVVDTGSVDETRAIARSFGARVVEFPWSDDFSAARNYSFEQCTADWIMWLDADDRVPPKSFIAFENIKSRLANHPLGVNVIHTPYRTGYSPNANGQYGLTIVRERIVLAKCGFRWRNPVYEFIDIGDSPPNYTDLAWVEHRPKEYDPPSHIKRNLHILQSSIARGDDSFRTLLYTGRCMVRLARWNESLPYLERCRSDAPNRSYRYEACIALAQSHFALGDSEGSERYLLEAIGVDGRQADAFFLLGNYYREMRRYDCALAFYHAALGASSNRRQLGSTPARSWGPLEGIGDCEMMLNNREEALRYFRAAHASAPWIQRLIQKVTDSATRWVPE